MKKGRKTHKFHFLRVLAAHLGAPALAVILSPFPLDAQFLMRSVDLVYLAQRADVIVQGRVTSVSHGSLSGYPNIPTVKVALEVENMVRGPVGKTYTFREIYVGLRAKEGKQDYGVGQRLLLFLPVPSQYGLSSPIGMGQGRFYIARGAGGSETIVNEYGNAGLFKSVEQAAKTAGKKLTASQSRMVRTQGGPVLLDEFVPLVRSFTTLPRIK